MRPLPRDILAADYLAILEENASALSAMRLPCVEPLIGGLRIIPDSNIADWLISSFRGKLYAIVDVSAQTPLRPDFMYI